MGIQSWMVKSWPMVEWYLPVRSKRWPLFQHVVSNVRDQTLPLGRRCGDTVWVGRVDGHNVGMSWDWVELRKGVVMLTDPNAIVCNVCFLTAQSSHQPALVATVSLNRFVRHLPWQGPVRAALDAGSTPAVVAHAARAPQVRWGRTAAPPQLPNDGLALRVAA